MPERWGRWQDYMSNRDKGYNNPTPIVARDGNTMERDAVLAAVEDRIRAIPGVLDMRFLDPDLKEEITHLEVLAERNGACGGLMPFVNRGVWEALGREVSLVIIGDLHLLVDNRGLLYMMDQKGHTIGEYVTPEQRLRIMESHPETSFISEDFILHTDVEICGEPYFLIDEIKFQYLDGVDGIDRVTSGSMSTMSDNYVREIMGFSGPKNWTHLVGFDLVK